MGLFSWLGGLFDDGSVGGGSVTDTVADENIVNPANGLPMVGGVGGLDVEGNPYGTDFTANNSIDTTSDMFESGIADCSSNDSFSSGMDDSFSSFDSSDW